MVCGGHCPLPLPTLSPLLHTPPPPYCDMVASQRQTAPAESMLEAAILPLQTLLLASFIYSPFVFILPPPKMDPALIPSLPRDCTQPSPPPTLFSLWSSHHETVCRSFSPQHTQHTHSLSPLLPPSLSSRHSPPCPAPLGGGGVALSPSLSFSPPSLRREAPCPVLCLSLSPFLLPHMYMLPSATSLPPFEPPVTTHSTRRMSIVCRPCL